MQKPQTNKIDLISLSDANTLSALFQERVKRSPSKIAYQEFNHHTKVWQSYTWRQTANEAARWQMAFAKEKLEPGDRIAIMLPNAWQWVAFDQAALGSGLVTVPIYTNDRAENIAYMVQNAGIKLLFIDTAAQWHQLSGSLEKLDILERVITRQNFPNANHIKVTDLDNWLPIGEFPLEDKVTNPDSLATIIYTSGTTGRPKGVMLSHQNILWNAASVAQQVTGYPDDHFLSFLPLSHTFERTAGYYLPILINAQVSYCRSIPELSEDLQIIKPTIIISVPRIFERVYGRISAQLEKKSNLAKKLFLLTEQIGYQRFQKQQGRAKFHAANLLWPLLNLLVAKKIRSRLGGRLRVAACGGAPLSPIVSERFISLGVPIIQGYGLTETSPIVSVNTLDDNEPLSVGRTIPGAKVKIGPQDELLIKSPGVMLGYWEDPAATESAIDHDGWLHSGDKAETLEGRIYIIGRLKEIIVMANGEKVPPNDIEAAICNDPLFEQCLLVGEGLPFLSCLLVIDPSAWEKFAASFPHDSNHESLTNPKLLEAALVRIGLQLKSFPGYAQIRRISLLKEPWTVENELITPTLKLRRDHILQHHQTLIEKMYEGHA